MTRVYEKRDINRIGNISAAILVAVMIYGIWELWSAFVVGTNDTWGAMFGVVFVGGGLIGMNSTWTENRDQVVWFDADLETGQGRIAVWRPLRPLIIDVPLDQMRDWRYWVKVAKRNMRTHYLVVALPDYPRPVYFDLGRTEEIPEVFRRLAPDEIHEFEQNTGRLKDDDEEEET
ncbi:hypothetical protein [Bauldia sp.]|uniref:hypothetical protein n=1 Tax=Bauldia sp. TaxID=2575872 RepID=UPI003BA8EA6B